MVPVSASKTGDGLPTNPTFVPHNYLSLVNQTSVRRQSFFATSRISLVRITAG